MLEINDHKCNKENTIKAVGKSQSYKKIDKNAIFYDSNIKSSNTRLISENNYFINPKNIYILNNIHNNINDNSNNNKIVLKTENLNNKDFENNQHHYQNIDRKSRISVSLSGLGSDYCINSNHELINKINNQNKNPNDYYSNKFSSKADSSVNDINLNENNNNNNFCSNIVSSSNSNCIPKNMINFKSQNAKKNKEANIEILSEKKSETKTNLKEINIIVTDEEDLTRQSTIRMIRRNFEVNNLNRIFQLIIYEAMDGLDCLSKLFNLITEGSEVYCIISDESMYFLNGYECSLVVKKVIDKRQLKNIPFFLVTSYPRENFSSFFKKSVDDLYNKPINFEDINVIFRSLILNMKENDLFKKDRSYL
jgi:hypothetical protein